MECFELSAGLRETVGQIGTLRAWVWRPGQAVVRKVGETYYANSKISYAIIMKFIFEQSDFIKEENRLVLPCKSGQRYSRMIGLCRTERLVHLQFVQKFVSVRRCKKARQVPAKGVQAYDIPLACPRIPRRVCPVVILYRFNNGRTFVVRARGSTFKIATLCPFVRIRDLDGIISRCVYLCERIEAIEGNAAACASRRIIVRSTLLAFSLQRDEIIAKSDFR